MEFIDFTEADWSFLEAAATVGLEAPDVDAGKAEIVEVYLQSRVSGGEWSDELSGVLRDAFAIGWNVATENGTNDVAGKHRHVAEAVGIELAGRPSP